MKRLDLPYVQSRKNGRYWYFVKDKRIVGPLPHPSDPEFLTAYNRYKSGRHVKPVKQSFAKLIGEYKRSERYSRLAPSSRAIYDRRLAWLESVIGAFPVEKFKRHHALDMRDALRDTPTEANARISLLSVLMETAIDRGWIDRNPVTGTSYLQVEPESAKPWPLEVQKRFEAATDGSTRLFYELALGTGQRASDVLKMRWSDIEGGGINVKQQKTKKRLWVPFPPRLAKVLDEAPRNGLFIVSDNGLPITYNAMHRRFRTVLKGEYKIHGLRATKAVELARAGLDDDAIMSITGHDRARSLASYTGGERQKARAKKAVAPDDGA